MEEKKPRRIERVYVDADGVLCCDYVGDWDY
jgi:hypothetical protein